MEENKSNNGQRNNSALLVEAETLRHKPVVDESHAKKESEGGMTMFWRVFGGTILSIAALMVITAYNSISGALSDMRRDLNAQIETRSDYVKKADLERSTTSLWTGLKEIRAQAHTVDNLNERSRTLEQSVDRHVKNAGDERKELLARIEENRKSGVEDVRELTKKVEELRKALDEERKEYLRKLDDQRKSLEDERKEINRKFDEQQKELSSKLQVMAERLAAVESRQNIKPKSVTPPVTEPAAKKASAIDPDD